MTTGSQILLFLSAFGAFNGILISLYFFYIKPRTLSNKFLGGVLLMISIRILKSVLLFFNPDISKVFLQIGLSACLLIGPFLYFYCLSTMDILERQWIKWQYHLGFWLCFIIISGTLYPYQYNIQLWSSWIYKAINYSWLFYIFLSAITLRPIFKQIISKTIKTPHNMRFTLSVFLGVFIIWLAYFTSHYTSYIVGALSFTFIFFIMCLMAVKKYKSSEKYADKKFTSDQSAPLINKIQALMSEKILHKDPNLKLETVARQLGITAPHLSQLLNDNLQKPFASFINEYRIAEAQRMLTELPPLKMEVIMEECGFNSQSTFYNAFKKIKGTTPAKYRQEFSPEL